MTKYIIFVKTFFDYPDFNHRIVKPVCNEIYLVFMLYCCDVTKSQNITKHLLHILTFSNDRVFVMFDNGLIMFGNGFDNVRQYLYYV